MTDYDYGNTTEFETDLVRGVKRLPQGKCAFVAVDYYGDAEHYISETITDPTVDDIRRVCDAAIRKTGDSDHSFLEHLKRVAQQQGFLKVYMLEFGS